MLRTLKQMGMEILPDIFQQVVFGKTLDHDIWQQSILPSCWFLTIEKQNNLRQS